jgi:hypothetical protein
MTFADLRFKKGKLEKDGFTLSTTFMKIQFQLSERKTVDNRMPKPLLMLAAIALICSAGANSKNTTPLAFALSKPGGDSLAFCVPPPPVGSFHTVLAFCVPPPPPGSAGIA